jgi:hypothetical protein
VTPQSITIFLVRHIICNQGVITTLGIREKVRSMEELYIARLHMYLKGRGVFSKTGEKFMRQIYVDT